MNEYFFNFTLWPRTNLRLSDWIVTEMRFLFLDSRQTNQVSSRCPFQWKKRTIHVASAIFEFWMSNSMITKYGALPKQCKLKQWVQESLAELSGEIDNRRNRSILGNGTFSLCGRQMSSFGLPRTFCDCLSITRSLRIDTDTTVDDCSAHACICGHAFRSSILEAAQGLTCENQLRPGRRRFSLCSKRQQYWLSISWKRLNQEQWDRTFFKVYAEKSIRIPSPKPKLNLFGYWCKRKCRAISKVNKILALNVSMRSRLI